MENISGEISTNDSLTSYPTLAKVDIWYTTSTALILSSTFIVTILAIDIIVLNKCKRIPFQIKWLSNMFLVSSLLSDLNIIIMSIMYIIVDPIFTNVALYVRVMLASCFTNMGWGGSALLAIDRILALSFPLRYTSFVKKSLLTVIIFISGIVTFVIPCAGSFLSMFYICGPYLADCIMFDVMQPLRYYLTVTVSVFLIFNLIAYVQISKIMRRHLLSIQRNSAADTIMTISTSGNVTPGKDTRAQKKMMNLTKTICTIILIFVCLHFLPILHTIAFDILPGLRIMVWQMVLSCLSYFATSANAIFCSYMYIWRIQECKMMFLKTFMAWNPKCREEAERLRLSVYDIVINDKRSFSV